MRFTITARDEIGHHKGAGTNKEGTGTRLKRTRSEKLNKQLLQKEIGFHFRIAE